MYPVEYRETSRTRQQPSFQRMAGGLSASEIRQAVKEGLKMGTRGDRAVPSKPKVPPSGRTRRYMHPTPAVPKLDAPRQLTQELTEHARKVFAPGRLRRAARMVPHPALRFASAAWDLYDLWNEFNQYNPYPWWPPQAQGFPSSFRCNPGPRPTATGRTILAYTNGINPAVCLTGQALTIQSQATINSIMASGDNSIRWWREHTVAGPALRYDLLRQVVVNTTTYPLLAALTTSTSPNAGAQLGYTEPFAEPMPAANEPFPAPVPVRMISRARDRTGFAQPLGPKVGYESPQAEPSPDLPNGVEPGVVITYPPGGGRPNIRNMRAQNVKRKQPRKRLKELKLQMKGAPGIALAAAMMVTEGRDLVQALHAGLPRKYRSKSPKPQEMAMALWRHWDHVQWNQAFYHLVKNQVIDMMVGGTIGRATRHGTQITGGNVLHTAWTPGDWSTNRFWEEL